MNNLIVNQERHYSFHHDLLRVARFYMDSVDGKTECDRGEDFICLIMCSLAVESLCNTAGIMLIEHWQSDFEMAPPKAKLRLIFEKIGVEYKRDSEPFQTLNWLIKFRNSIAHAKPEPIHKSDSIAEKDLKNLFISGGPESKMEQLFSVKNARKALNAVTELMHLIANNVADDLAIRLLGDFSNVSSIPSKK